MSSWVRWSLPGVAALIVILAAMAGTPAAPARDPSPVDVRRTIAACPDLDTKAEVAVGALPETTAELRPGDQKISGEWHESGARDKAPIVTARSSRGSAGAMAFTRADDVIAHCPREHAERWWAGAGGERMRSTRLELVNLTDAPAVAKLTLWGHDGPIDTQSSIAVKPHRRKQIELSDLVAGQSELAVRLQVDRGAVSASMVDSGSAGPQILPATSGPAATTLVSGVERPAESELVLANPGENTARAKVSLVGADGPVAPEGVDNVKVPAGAVTTVDIPESAGADAAAIQVDATHPVAATARMRPGDHYAYAVAHPALRDGALVPLSMGGALPSPRVLVTAKKRTTVRIRTFDDAFDELAHHEYRVDGGTTQELQLGSDLKLGRASSALITGEVSGAAVYGSGNQLAALPLEPAVAQVLAPDIQIGSR